jgi:CheY-like chemotaxis protein/CHASE3 domain sensor protein
MSAVNIPARIASGVGVNAKRHAIIAMPVILAVVINAVYLFCAIRFGGADAELRRTYQAKAEVQTLMADLSHAEGGLGAYMLTRDVTFLESLDRARQLLPARENRLNTMFSDPPHVAELRQLVTAAGARLAALEQIREDIKAHGEVSSSSLMASRSEMHALQIIASTIMRRQDDLLTEQRGSAALFDTLATGAALVSALASIGAGIFAAVALTARNAAGVVRQDAAAQRRVTPATAAGPRLAGSVLIVDDDPRVRGLLHRWLAPHDVELREAADARAALEVISEWTPSVILCDVHMPGQDGLWLAERVRAVAPNTAIVLATGDAGISPFDSLRKGVVSYVLKPFIRDQVLAAVEQGLGWSADQTRQGDPKEPRPRSPEAKLGLFAGM